MFDFGFLGEYFNTFLKGVGVTLGISIITVFLGILLGSVLFFMKTSKFHIWKVNPLIVIASNSKESSKVVSCVRRWVVRGE